LHYEKPERAAAERIVPFSWRSDQTNAEGSK